MIKCEACEGRGRVRCAVCQGFCTLPAEAGVLGPKLCPKCNGRGWLLTETVEQLDIGSDLQDELVAALILRVEQLEQTNRRA